MIETNALIQSLSSNLAPVRRLRPPLVRAGAWLVLAVVLISLMAMLHGGVRPQFAERLRDSSYAIALFASMATGVLAAIGAFLTSLPDRSRHWSWLPMPALLVWMANIGYQCFAGWVPVPPGAVTVEAASSCLTTLALTSLPLSLAMLSMLRYAAVLRSTSVVLLGGLAVSALASFALSLFHPLDATAMILVWNLGTCILFLILASLLNRRWSSRRKRAGHPLG